MGCVSQKQSRKFTFSQNGRLRLQSQSISQNIPIYSLRKPCTNQESISTADIRKQILPNRSIDIVNDEEFILKRDRRLIQSDEQSPTTTPKFNQKTPNSFGQRQIVRLA